MIGSSAIGCILLTASLALAAGSTPAGSPQSVEPTQSTAPTAPLGAPAKPPTGYLTLCERNPEECRGPDNIDGEADDVIREEAGAILYARAFADPNAPAAVAEPPPAPDPTSAVLTITPPLLALMYRVNLLVNREMRMQSDEAQYDMADYWNVASFEDRNGDCEDYALTKRRLLINAGVPPDVLTFGIVRTSWGELHAILIVTTDQGDMILDNLTGDILHWNNTGYHWIKRQTPGQPFDWRRVDS
jgi:predicted transglutaminase-like cysteine proteinase